MVNIQRVQMLVDALRSGEYTQCKNRLSDMDASGQARHCCLGVAHEIHKAATGIAFVRTRASLSLPARDWFGFEHSDPFLGTSRATTWNDDLNKTFPEIADAFENTYIKKTPANAGVMTEGNNIG